MTQLISNPIIMHLIIALVIIAAGLFFYHLLSQAMLHRASSHIPDFQAYKPGKPLLLFFTSPSCSPCKTYQRPAIEKLQKLVGSRVEVVEIDAAAQPELASQWGVWSVPTTFIIDSDGKPCHVNNGIASAEKLLQQLETIL